VLLLLLTTSCGSTSDRKKDHGFFTSGSREADQRASQRMAKSEQLAGSGEGAGEKEGKGEKARGGDQGGNGPGPVQVEGKQTLFDRLGGEGGLTAIVDDFLPRAMQDPRVNWRRQGVKRGGLFDRGPAVAWEATHANVAKLKKHMVQFLSLATGGPARYEGKNMKSAHADMRITNPEFDAVIGDLKATLDRLQIANREQKELLAIIESARPQIVEER
jgi:hemoglobin